MTSMTTVLSELDRIVPRIRNRGGTTRRLATRVGPLFVAAAAVVGCGDLQEGDEPEAIETQTEQIINGTTVTTDTWGSPFTGCSSTMLRDRWVLTVKHCLPSVGGTATLKNGTVAHFQAPIFAHPDEFQDVAIARIDTPLVPSGSVSTSGPYPLYRGSEAQLLNQTVNVQGWGDNFCPPGGGQCSGFGTLRSGNLVVDHIGPADPDLCVGRCFLTPHGNVQTAGGDSGGGVRSTPGAVQLSKVVGVVAGTSQTENYHQSVPWFRDWANGIIGSAPTFGQLTGYERNDLINTVLYVNSSHIIELSSSGFTNWFRSDLTSFISGATNVATNSNPTAFIRFDGYASIAYRDTSNHIQELALQHGGTWSKRDLTPTGSGAPTATGSPASYGRTDRVGIVLYRSQSSPADHIIEISFSPGGNPGWNDMTQIFGLPNTASDPVGYVRADGANAVVYRSSPDNHVRELAAFYGQNWSPADLSKTNATAAGQPRPFTLQDGTSAVVYRSSDNHVRLLTRAATDTTGNWTPRDLTGGTSFEQALSDPFGYVRADGRAAVIFKTSDFHVHQLTWSGGPNWAHEDMMTAPWGNPPVAGGFGMAAYVTSDRVSTVVYRTSDNHVHQLTQTLLGTRGNADLTQSAGGGV